ncbi:hypothetical protein ACLOJK_013476 [Asimina triloba]
MARCCAALDLDVRKPVIELDINLVDSSSSCRTSLQVKYTVGTEIPMKRIREWLDYHLEVTHDREKLVNLGLFGHTVRTIVTTFLSTSWCFDSIKPVPEPRRAEVGQFFPGPPHPHTPPPQPAPPRSAKQGWDAAIINNLSWTLGTIARSSYWAHLRSP